MKKWGSNVDPTKADPPLKQMGDNWPPILQFMPQIQQKQHDYAQRQSNQTGPHSAIQRQALINSHPVHACPSIRWNNLPLFPLPLAPSPSF